MLSIPITTVSVRLSAVKNGKPGGKPVSRNRESLSRDARVMASARKMMKKKKATSNARLYMELFGTGMTTSCNACRLDLGLDPDSNETCYMSMLNYIKSTTTRE